MPELRQRMADELATNIYVIPHWQEFLPWRTVFPTVPRHELIPDTVWVNNGAGLVPLYRTDDSRRRLDLTNSCGVASATAPASVTRCAV